MGFLLPRLWGLQRTINQIHSTHTTGSIWGQSGGNFWKKWKIEKIEEKIGKNLTKIASQRSGHFLVWNPKKSKKMQKIWKNRFKRDKINGLTQIMWYSSYWGFGVCNAPSTKFIAHAQLALSELKVTEISEKSEKIEKYRKNR